jgi:uncharacterized pyridoxal phosphate-containing UPF0001 family protein
LVDLNGAFEGKPMNAASVTQIVSANGHPTEKISEFIDFHLRPFVENLPSHIKDTIDYLKKMENLIWFP